MQLHQNLLNLIQQQRSYAPVPNRAGGPARPAAGDKGAWAAPQPAGAQPSSSSPQQRMDAMLKNLSPAQVEALNAHGAAALNQAGTDQAAVARGAPGAAQTTGFRAQVPDGAVDAPGAGFGPSAAARQHSLKRALQDYFDQQSRLPPNGATGFDPLLTPAWPSLQLPA